MGFIELTPGAALANRLTMLATVLAAVVPVLVAGAALEFAFASAAVLSIDHVACGACGCGAGGRRHDGCQSKISPVHEAVAVVETELPPVLHDDGRLHVAVAGFRCLEVVNDDVQLD